MPEALYFTEDEAANHLLADDPFALLVGFALDQQVTVQKAFAGPLAIQERLGSLDAATLADADLEPVFRERPAIQVKSLGAVLAKRFGVPVAQELVPGHPTLGDVDSAQALTDYQAAKKAHKAEWLASKSAR